MGFLFEVGIWWCAHARFKKDWVLIRHGRD